jgi:hypothetical protein
MKGAPSYAIAKATEEHREKRHGSHSTLNLLMYMEPEDVKEAKHTILKKMKCEQKSA